MKKRILLLGVGLLALGLATTFAACVTPATRTDELKDNQLSKKLVSQFQVSAVVMPISYDGFADFNELVLPVVQDNTSIEKVDVVATDDVVAESFSMVQERERIRPESTMQRFILYTTTTIPYQNRFRPSLLHRMRYRRPSDINYTSSYNLRSIWRSNLYKDKKLLSVSFC